MRAETIEQYHVIEYIKKNFREDKIYINLIDRCTIQVIDFNNDTILFRYDKNYNQIEIIDDEKKIKDIRTK